MSKLPEVEAAKNLMTEAMAWSVMKWLREKKRVRKTADQANAALDKWGEGVKRSWTDGVRDAYEVLLAEEGSGRSPKKRKSDISPEVLQIAKKIKVADDEAYRARMDAEKTFDDADRQLSTSLAREGCRKAIHAWELREKAIHKAEAVLNSK